ncbi:transporter substrate-binding protein [Gordonia sp. VNK21]|uniref:transporter substrate-binding protein n=1 Tax=Gordonia sp. VNK21 TaxID=3382483 RepID=UPI0038D4875F
MKLGVLCSLTGRRQEIGQSILDGALAAVSQINAAGGIGGEPIEPVIADTRSDVAGTIEGAVSLRAGGVKVLVGGYTSAARVAVRPALQTVDALLLYPTYFEGEETDPNVFYCGASPNQFLGGYLEWIAGNLGSRMYLVGSDYIYPRVLGEAIQVLGRRRGLETVGDWFAPLGETELDAVIEDIARAAPDVIICNLVGAESTASFYTAHRRAGLTAASMPIAATVTTEIDLAHMPTEVSDGHYMAASYFSGLTSPANARFRAELAARGQRRAHAAQVGAYNGVRAAALAYELTGSDEVAEMRSALRSVTVDENPEGIAFGFDDEHYSTHPAYIGRARGGDYEVIAGFDPVAAQPWWSDRSDRRGLSYR